MPSLPPEPSAFLRLPTEVRMMIYERIPIEVKEHKLLKYSLFAQNPFLATYRHVYDEAEDIITLSIRAAVHVCSRISRWRVDISCSSRLLKIGCEEAPVRDTPPGNSTLLQKSPRIEVRLKHIPNNIPLRQLLACVNQPEYPPLKGLNYEFRMIFGNLELEERVLSKATKFRINLCLSSYPHTIDKLHLSKEVECGEFGDDWSALQCYRGSSY
ncbi:hypothetical protein HBI46_086590 [Parastagonospora nodorum]|nr:hypothetical protein HBH82_110880 [Parastagonospora nodorum]KAH4693991.1 hypothetical protein HBH67_221560 [Parastagonospora nodorum]KAH5176082.1 hypothetical protein HBH76_215500 [Parastagonospora nodorum]KAH5421296.1 hypothetical protein HBI46_086590 [Parastagonospora nodorum]KAH5997862.1 hypothetical protein HBI83_228360 [Parastagonospora nodorum]